MSIEHMIVIGDFNVVWQVVNRFNGNMVNDVEIEDFENLLLTTSLVEAKISGNFYSWSNSSVGADKVMSSIDKAFVNHSWLMKYNDVVVQY